MIYIVIDMSVSPYFAVSASPEELDADWLVLENFNCNFTFTDHPTN